MPAIVSQREDIFVTDVFNLANFDMHDEVDLAIRNPSTGKPTTWIWTFYGPGHARTVELANRITRESLRELAEQRQARINGGAYEPAEVSPDDMRARNVDNIVARLKGFTAVDLGNGKLVFSAAAARDLLLDRKKGWLLTQVMEFLGSEKNFIRPSAKA